MRHQFVCVLAVAVALAADAAARGEYTVSECVVGAGGGGMSGGGASVVGTVGQPTIGVVVGESCTNEIGFWYQPGWTLTGIEENTLPVRFWLEQNRPNPFNPVTMLRYSLPERSRVSIVVYDVAGRQVRVLVDEERDAGFYETSLEASGLGSGVYFCRMVSGAFVQTRKIILLK